MSLFPKALEIILGLEGSFSDDPHDPGGVTKFGIAQTHHSDIAVTEITRGQAADIYRLQYWQACKCDDLPGPLALAVFDAAVNQGPRTAVRLLQLALKVTPDGLIGPATLAAADRCNPASVLIDFLSLRAVRYSATQNADKYLRGWMRRLFIVMYYALSDVFNPDLSSRA